VIREYSETDCDYLTYEEQTSLMEDWFSGKLRFTEDQDKVETLDSLEDLVEEQLESFKAI